MRSRNYGIILSGGSRSWMRSVPCAKSRFANRAQAVAEAYAERGDRTSLVVCATHDEIDRVTEAIRGQRKKSANSVKALVSSAAFRLVGPWRRKWTARTSGLAKSWSFTRRSRASPNTNRRR